MGWINCVGLDECVGSVELGLAESLGRESQNGFR